MKYRRGYKTRAKRRYGRRSSRKVYRARRRLALRRKIGFRM